MSQGYGHVRTPLGGLIGPESQLLDVFSFSYIYPQLNFPQLLHDPLEMCEILCMGMCSIFGISQALGTYWATGPRHPNRGLLEAILYTYLRRLVVVVLQSYQDGDAKLAGRVVGPLKLRQSMATGNSASARLAS